MRRALLRAAVVGLGAGLLAGVAVMAISWAENSQLEIHDGAGHVHWGYWFTFGASWAVPAFVVVGLIALVALRVRR